MAVAPDVGDSTGKNIDAWKKVGAKIPSVATNVPDEPIPPLPSVEIIEPVRASDFITASKVRETAAEAVDSDEDIRDFLDKMLEHIASVAAEGDSDEAGVNTSMLRPRTKQIIVEELRARGFRITNNNKASITVSWEPRPISEIAAAVFKYGLLFIAVAMFVYVLAVQFKKPSTPVQAQQQVEMPRR
jgi:hypothetical protein